jgi:hypothetical protein
MMVMVDVQSQAVRLLRNNRAMPVERFDLEEMLFLTTRLRWFAGELVPVADFSESDLKHLQAILGRHFDMDD